MPTQDRHIQQMVRDLHAQTHAQQLLDNFKAIATRADGPIRPFCASIHWLHDFKHRNRFINTHHPIIRPNRQKDKSNSTTLFNSFLLCTLPHYSQDRIINMDETPLPFAPGKWNVISKIGDPTKLCTGTRHIKHSYSYTHTLVKWLAPLPCFIFMCP